MKSEMESRTRKGLNGGMQVICLLTTCSSEQLRHRPLIGDFRDVEIRTEGSSLSIEISDQSQRDAEIG